MLNKLNYILKKPFRNGRFFCLWILFISLLGFSQPQLKFKDTKINFGFVKKGDIVTIEYNFVNIGSEPLIITQANVECSCTTIYFPKQPIAPNQRDKVIVKFDTKSVYDRQDRIVEIVSNAKNSNQKVRFKGIVLK